MLSGDAAETDWREPAGTGLQAHPECLRGAQSLRRLQSLPDPVALWTLWREPMTDLLWRELEGGLLQMALL